MRSEIRMLGCLVALFGLSHAGCKGKSIETQAATTASGQNFSVPVPPDYKLITDQRVNSGQGGVTLVANTRVSKDAFLGSVAVTPVVTQEKVASSDAATCGQIATLMMQGAPVRIENHGLVDTALGKTCQWTVVDNNVAPRAARGTVMCQDGLKCWVVTCNYDTRDDKALKACGQVLAGWKYN